MCGLVGTDAVGDGYWVQDADPNDGGQKMLMRKGPGKRM